MTTRLRCMVPFCKRWRGRRKGDPPNGYPSDSEWICGDHWRLISSKRRKAYRRAVRREEDAKSFSVPSSSPGFISFSSKAQFIEHSRARDAANRLWARLARQAIERAAGVSA